MRDTARFRGTSREVEQAARELRAAPTPAEAALWSRLCARQLNGYKFRAQHPLGRFILDFVCARARLVIEIDGGVHREREANDRERDEILAARGYRVLRFSNEAVLENTEAVLAEICHHLGGDSLITE